MPILLVEAPSLNRMKIPTMNDSYPKKNLLHQIIALALKV